MKDREFCIVFTYAPGAPKFREVALCFGSGDAEEWALDLIDGYDNCTIHSIFYADPGTVFVDGTSILEAVH
jgi:hypothetical protein